MLQICTHPKNSKPTFDSQVWGNLCVWKKRGVLWGHLLQVFGRWKSWRIFERQLRRVHAPQRSRKQQQSQHYHLPGQPKKSPEDGLIFFVRAPQWTKKMCQKGPFFPSTSFSAPPPRSLLLCFSKFQQWKCIFHSMRMLPGSNFSRGNQFATQLSSLFCPTIVPLIMLIITFTVPADSLQKIPLRCFICNHPLC